MILKDQLYQIVNIEKSGDSSTYILRIPDTHPLFKGHFPESPVLPGVCILQIIKELAEMDLASASPLGYSEIKQCKFLTPVAMNQPATVLVTIALQPEGASWNFSASLKSESILHASLKAVLTTKQ